MTPTEVTIATAALLIAPGPTNILLAIAGAERGLMRVWNLIPLAFAAYLVTVLPLTFAGVGLLAAYPGLRPAITLFAAAWVMWLALVMWRQTTSGTATVTGRLVFVTTVLNPKALIFGLAILPSAAPVWANILGFGVQVVVISAIWAAFGTALARGKGQNGHSLTPWLRRGASLWLFIVAIGLFTRAITA